MSTPKLISDTGLSLEQEQALALARARRRRAEAEASKPAPVASKAPPAPVPKPAPAIPASGMGAMGSRAPVDAAAYAATVPQFKPQPANPNAPNPIDTAWRQGVAKVNTEFNEARRAPTPAEQAAADAEAEKNRLANVEALANSVGAMGFQGDSIAPTQVTDDAGNMVAQANLSRALPVRFGANALNAAGPGMVNGTLEIGDALFGPGPSYDYFGNSLTDDFSDTKFKPRVTFGDAAVAPKPPTEMVPSIPLDPALGAVEGGVDFGGQLLGVAATLGRGVPRGLGVGGVATSIGAKGTPLAKTLGYGTRVAGEIGENVLYAGALGATMAPDGQRAQTAAQFASDPLNILAIPAASLIYRGTIALKTMGARVTPEAVQIQQAMQTLQRGDANPDQLQAAARTIDEMTPPAPDAGPAPSQADPAAPPPGAAQGSTGGRSSMFSSGSIYSVSTADNGVFDASLNRTHDGGAVIFHDKGTIPITPEFAKGKSDEELLAYYFEPVGFQGATKGPTTQGAAQAAPQAPPAAAGAAANPQATQRAQQLLDGVDAGGIPSNPILVNRIARDLGLDVADDAPMADTIERVRTELAQQGQPTVPQGPAGAAQGATQPPPVQPPPAAPIGMAVPPPATATQAASSADVQLPTLTRAEKRAADILIKRLEADGVSWDDVKRVAASMGRRGDSGVYETIGELVAYVDGSSGANMRGLQMAGGTIPGATQERIVGRVAENDARLPQRVTRAATRATGQMAENAVNTLQALNQRLRTESGPRYETFYSAPVDPRVFANEVLPILNTEAGQVAARQALEAIKGKAARLKARVASGKASEGQLREYAHAQEAARSLEGYLKDPIRGTDIPSPYALNRIKRAFDNQIEAAGQGSEIAKDIRGTKTDFADGVSNATGGKYGEALGFYEGSKRLEEAFQFGNSALSKKSWQLKLEMEQGLKGRAWSGGEIEAIAMGVARQIEDLIEANDQRALTMLIKGKALENLATALGDPKAAARFEQSMRRLAANREWGRRVAKGSDTAMRQASVAEMATEADDAVLRNLDRMDKTQTPPTPFGLGWDLLVSPIIRGAKDSYQRFRYAGLHDPEVNKILAPILGDAATPETLKAADRIISARLAEKAQKQGPVAIGYGSPPKPKPAAPSAKPAPKPKRSPPGNKLKAPGKPPAKTGGKKPPQSNASPMVTSALLGGAAGAAAAPEDARGIGFVAGAAGGAFLGNRLSKMGGSKPGVAASAPARIKRIEDMVAVGDKGVVDVARSMPKADVLEAASRIASQGVNGGVRITNLDEAIQIIDDAAEFRSFANDITRSDQGLAPYPELRTPMKSGAGEVVPFSKPKPAPGAGGKPQPVGAKAALDPDLPPPPKERFLVGSDGSRKSLGTAGEEKTVKFTAPSGKQFQIEFRRDGDAMGVDFREVGAKANYKPTATGAAGGDAAAVRAATQEANAVLSAVQDAIKADVSQFGRPRYTFVGETTQQSRIYQQMARTTEPPKGYRWEGPDSNGAVHLQRADLAPPSKGPGGKPPTGTKLSAFPGGTAAQAASGAGGVAYGYANPVDANEDGVIDDQDRAITATTLGLGGLTAAGLARNALSRGPRGVNPPPGKLNTFGGVNAKTADRAALARAQQMDTAGASRDDIWDQTGWFKGVDGKWRFEIDDSGASLTGKTHGFLGNTNPASERLLGDGRPVMEHNALYDAYPDLRGAHASISGKGGEYTPVSENNFETIRAGQEDPLSIMLHEAGGHGVQAREGFARGGAMNDDLLPSDMAAHNHTQLSKRSQDILAMPHVIAAQKRLDELRSKWQGRDNIPSDVVEELKAIQNMPEKRELARIKAEATGQLRKASDFGVRNLFTREQLFDGYKRLAGEVEARNVQTRDAMRRRGETPGRPWDTQDVPDDQQIVRFGGGKAESRPTKPPPASNAFGGGKGPPKPPPARKPAGGNRLRIAPGVEVLPRDPNAPPPPKRNKGAYEMPTSKDFQEEALRKELRAARAENTRDRSRYAMRDNREELWAASEAREQRATEALADYLAEKAAKTQRGAGRRDRYYNAKDFVNTERGGVAIAAGLGAAGLAGTGAMLALSSMGGDEKKPKGPPVMSPSDPRFYWERVVTKNKTIMQDVQWALGEWGHWDKEVPRTGANGTNTKEGIRAWRESENLDPDKPMTRQELTRLLAGPGGYEGDGGKWGKKGTWYTSEGKAVRVPQ